jgi:hypothetical protein
MVNELLSEGATAVDGSRLRAVAHCAPFVPVVEHVINGAAAIAMLPVSLVLNRAVKARSARAAAGTTSANARTPTTAPTRTFVADRSLLLPVPTRTTSTVKPLRGRR